MSLGNSSLNAMDPSFSLWNASPLQDIRIAARTVSDIQVSGPSVTLAQVEVASPKALAALSGPFNRKGARNVDVKPHAIIDVLTSVTKRCRTAIGIIRLDSGTSPLQSSWRLLDGSWSTSLTTMGHGATTSDHHLSNVGSLMVTDMVT